MIKKAIKSIDYDINVMAGPPQKLPDHRDYETELKNEKVHRALKMKKKFDF